MKNSEWNGTDGITAKVESGKTFDTAKKLTVTAKSANAGDSETGWVLKSGNNTVGYNLATKDGTYNSTAKAASWEFKAGEITTSGTNKPMGIIVEDYTDKPAGEYTDTVTFTAKVESASRTTRQARR